MCSKLWRSSCCINSSGAEFRHSRETTIVFYRLGDQYVLWEKGNICTSSWMGSLSFYSCAVISLPDYVKREIIPLGWWRYNYRIFVQSLRSDSIHVRAEWADETDGGTEGEDGMNSRKADRRRGRRGQVAWLFTPRLTDLDNGATASDSDSSLR